MALPVALDLDRRHFIKGCAGLALTGLWPGGASAAIDPASPRVLWVLLRGGMDALTAVPPVGDIDLPRLRPTISLQAPLPLNADFSLHPSLAYAHGLWQQGQLQIVHATGFAYTGRSHFEGQDIMQTGSAKPYTSPTGFVGRALEMSGQSAQGVAISIPMPLLLRGSPESATEYPNWMRPASDSLLSALQREWRNEPALLPIAQQLQTDRQNLQAQLRSGMQVPGFQESRSLGSLARLAGQRMRQPDGPRVGLIDIPGGFDTHASQGADSGLHADRLKDLDQVFRGFREGMDAEWANALVVTITEFGRTVKENGNQGTDHGVGSCILLAGGWLKRSAVVADWRGLNASELIDGRDLPTTIDACAVYAKVMERAFSLNSQTLQQSVLPHRPHPLLADWL